MSVLVNKEFEALTECRTEMHRACCMLPVAWRHAPQARVRNAAHHHQSTGGAKRSPHGERSEPSGAKRVRPSDSEVMGWDGLISDRLVSKSPSG